MREESEDRNEVVHEVDDLIRDAIICGDPADVEALKNIFKDLRS